MAHDDVRTLAEDFGEVREASSLITSVLWILGMTSSQASRHCTVNTSRWMTSVELTPEKCQCTRVFVHIFNIKGIATFCISKFYVRTHKTTRDSWPVLATQKACNMHKEWRLTEETQFQQCSALMSKYKKMSKSTSLQLLATGLHGGVFQPTA